MRTRLRFDCNEKCRARGGPTALSATEAITNLPTALGGGGGRYGFGAVTSARSARVIQLAVKLYF